MAAPSIFQYPSPLVKRFLSLSEAFFLHCLQSWRVTRVCLCCFQHMVRERLRVESIPVPKNRESIFLYHHFGQRIAKESIVYHKELIPNRFWIHFFGKSTQQPPWDWSSVLSSTIHLWDRAVSWLIAGVWRANFRFQPACNNGAYSCVENRLPSTAILGAQL